MKPAVILLCATLTGPAMAETVLAARTIRANSLISAQDLVVEEGNVAGAASRIDEVAGLEARVSLYAGRPVALADIGPPALVERNQIVALVFETGGLRISTEGRSLSRGGVGDFIRVMNLSSRTTVSGKIMPDGRIIVSR